MSFRLKGRLFPWLLLLAGVAGMGGLTAWYFYQIQQAFHRSHHYWVDRVSTMVMAERLSPVRLIDQLPIDDTSQWYRAAEPYHDVVALFLIDQKEHTSLRWVRPTLQAKVEPLDPRLAVLQLRALETDKTQLGPVLALTDVPYCTVVRPLDDSRVLVAFIRTPGIWTILNQETTSWHLHTYIYDFEGHPMFLSGTVETVSVPLPAVLREVRTGRRTGRVKLMGEHAWQWLGSYHYDEPTDWIYVILEPSPWIYSPVIFFLVSLFGVLIITRLPFRASESLRQQSLTGELSQFAQRVDNFVHGRETILKEPPPVLRELTPIVHGLRWIMPQWKKAEAFPRELNLERKLLSLLIESLPEGILFFNADGKLQLANELGRVFLELQQETGRETKMVSGVQIARGFLEPYLEPVLTGAQPNLGKEVELNWADGKRLYRVWVERVEGDPGKALGYITVIRDITFRKQREYMQEQVLSGITHDLRGPLSAMMGYIDLTRRQAGDTLPPKIAEYLKLAREAGVRLSQMVSDILDVVRFEQGKIDMEPQVIPINEVFQRLTNTFGVLAEQKKIILKVGSPAEAFSVWGDRKLLDRVFDNLVSNAIKFTPPEGTITVTARHDPDRSVFEVTDTGRGIPREAQSRIFEKFQQVRPGDRSSGYGLGLAVAKFIVEAHKGEIHVTSDVGAGSTFSFWVPDHPEHMDAGASTPAPPAA